MAETTLNFTTYLASLPVMRSSRQLGLEFVPGNPQTSHEMRNALSHHLGYTFYDQGPQVQLSQSAIDLFPGAARFFERMAARDRHGKNHIARLQERHTYDHNDLYEQVVVADNALTVNAYTGVVGFLDSSKRMHKNRQGVNEITRRYVRRLEEVLLGDTVSLNLNRTSTVVGKYTDLIHSLWNTMSFEQKVEKMITFQDILVEFFGEMGSLLQTRRGISRETTAIQLHRFPAAVGA